MPSFLWYSAPTASCGSQESWPVHRIAQQLDLDADDILGHAEAVEGCTGHVELVTGVRHLHAIERANGDSIRAELKVFQLNIGEVGVRAPAIARAIAADEGQRDQAAAARAFQIVESRGEQEFSFITAKQIIGRRSPSTQESSLPGSTQSPRQPAKRENVSLFLTPATERAAKIQHRHANGFAIRMTRA